MKLTTTTKTPILALATTLPFALPAASGWRNITFQSLASPADALQCATDQHGYGTVGIDADRADTVPLADCQRMLNRTLMGSGVWNIQGLGDDDTGAGDEWSWLASMWSCTFFVAAVPRTGTEGMSFTIGTEDVRNAVKYVVHNFDLGNGTVNATRGRITGCPGATVDVEWIVYDGQNQPTGLPPR